MWLSYYTPTDDAQLKARMNAWIGYRAPFDGWPPPAPQGYVPPATQSALAAENARLRAALEVANRRIETRNQLTLDFANLLAHHLRTPLGVIKGYVGTMLSTNLALSGTERYEFLDVIDEETDNLTHLVNQIVDLALLDAGAVRITAERVDVAGLLREVATTFPTHPIRVALPAALPAIWGDAPQLRQVLSELVDNAQRFTPPGSPITLSAQLTTDGHMVQLTVRDSGPGLPAEALKPIFGPFYWADGGMHRQMAGAGLGLTLARGWVEAHGGMIWAENNADKGLSFHVTLPTAAAAGR